ncbi:MAG TPA: hypothetical protein VHT96_15815 [Clostridia bacterium]|nr:hypothetical protein [Clostridia bacterium]
MRPLEAEPAGAELLVSVLPDIDPLASVLADTDPLAPALPDTELVSPKPGLKVVVIATVVDICGVAVKLTLGVAVRSRLGVAVKVLVRLLIKFLIVFIADIILFIGPKAGHILNKAILKLLPFPIFIPPCITMTVCLI